MFLQELGEREGVVQGGEARLRSVQAQLDGRERELEQRERAVQEQQQVRGVRGPPPGELPSP